MDMLSTLLEITIYSGVIWMAIMLLKTVLRNKMSPFLHYAVWSILILRLIIPATVESPVHLITLPSETGTAAAAAVNDAEAGGFDFMTSSAGPYAQEPEVIYPDTSAPAVQSGGRAAAANPPVKLALPQALLIVWLGGVAVCLGYLAALAILLRRKIKSKASEPSSRLILLLEQVKAELGVSARLRMVCQYEYGTPALLFPRTVLMPMDTLAAMDDGQVKNCLRHECMHYKRGDHAMSLVLSLLSAVYWFNPFVWLANHQIRKDMETACDSAVVRPMSPPARRDYATLVLGMFSRAKHTQIALSMAQESTKKMAERRIQGIFMRNKSKRGVRITAAVLAAVLLVCCFTTACQPTPEEEIVIGKGDDLSGAIVSASNEITQDTAGDALYALLGAPRHWNLQTTALGGKLNISADVDITLPGVSALPAATAVLRDFSQEEIESIVGTVLGDNLTFTETADYTKESLQQLIVEIQRNLAEQEAGGIMSEGVIYSESDLEYYQGLYDGAPSESELAKKDLTVETLTSYQSYRGVSVNTAMDGQAYAIRAGSALSPDVVRVITITTGTSAAYFGGTYLDAPYGVTLTKEEAAKQAQALASQLTDELTLCYIAPTAASKNETERNWGWACVFMREINGCPTAYESKDVGTDMEDETKNPVRYEKMVIVIDDQGLTGFTWENPMTVTSIDNENISVLSFDDIEQIALEQLANRFQYYVDERDGSDPGCTAVVTKVELGLMRVMKANSGEYYYIPVWNFFSNIAHTEAYIEKWGAKAVTTFTVENCVDKDGNPYSFVTGYPWAWGAITLSAIDGSLIDRNLGY
jgi:Antirepressor regulating drug resistance, predicted signal transduction N-terminal membrane component